MCACTTVGAHAYVCIHTVTKLFVYTCSCGMVAIATNQVVSACLINASSVNMFLLINKCLVKTDYTLVNNLWTLDKPMASLSTWHLGFLFWMAVLLIYNRTMSPLPVSIQL